MSKVLKLVGWILAILVLAVGVILGWHYKSDIPGSVIKEQFSLPDSRYLDINGKEIHYRIEGKGPALVLVHGFGGNLRNWSKISAILKDSFTVVSMDLPGYGITGPCNNCTYDNPNQVTFLKRFTESIGIDSFYLGGNSMGGGIAWNYALEYPEDVRKLLLFNASGYPKQDQSDKPILAFRLLKMPVLKQILPKITPTSIIEKTVKQVYGTPPVNVEEEIDIYMNLIRREGNRMVLIERMNSVWQDRSSEIKSIAIPTLILWGTEDQLIHFNNANLFDKDLPNSYKIIYEGVGHMPMDEIPQQVASDIRSFL